MCYLDSCYLDLIAMFTSTLTSFIVAFFFAKILKSKKNSKHEWVKYFAVIFGSYLVCRIHPFFYEWRALFMASSYLVAMFCFSNDKIWKKIFLFLATYFFMLAVDIPTCTFIFSKYGYTYAEVNSMLDEQYYELYNLLFSDYNTLAMNGLNNVSLTFLYISMLMLIKKETRHFYVWLICFVVTILVGSNCVFSYLYLDGIISLIVLLVCQVIAIVLLIYIVQKLSIHLKYDESVEENNFLKEKEKMQLSYYEMMKSREDEVRKINHDIKNNLQVMYSLDDEGKRKEMIEKINTNLDKHYLKKYTSQDILNVVLNIKVNEARNKKINIDVSVKRKLDFMEDIDVSNLITNVLDNAIEAAEKTNDKSINLVIKKKMNYVIIECENSFNGEVKINKKKQLVTTKNGDHGYGTKIIKNVVDKYRGILEYEYENSIFKVIIMFEV